MEASKYRIEPKDRFLESMQRKHNKGGTDKDALKAKPIIMKDLDYVEIPRKTHLMGQPGKTSVRKTKTNENPLHGGNPESMS